MTSGSAYGTEAFTLAYLDRYPSKNYLEGTKWPHSLAGEYSPDTSSVLDVGCGAEGITVNAFTEEHTIVLYRPETYINAIEASGLELIGVEDPPEHLSSSMRAGLHRPSDCLAEDFAFI